MKARLVGKPGGEGSERTKTFTFEREFTLGRSEHNSLAVQHSSVSGEHARICFDESQNAYVLEDLDSLNGTQLDGTTVSGPETLGKLHVITLARKLDFIFQDLEAAGPEEVAAARPEAAKPVAKEPPPATPVVAVPPAAPRIAEEKPATGAPAPDELPIETTSPSRPGEGTDVEEGGIKLPTGIADAGAGEGTRIEEGGFKLPAGIGDADAEGTRIEEGGFKLPAGIGDADAEGTRIEEGGFKLPAGIGDADAEGTRIEEGGFKLPAGIGDADAEGTRIEEGGFKLPAGIGDADAEGTRIEEGGFKLPAGIGDADAEGTRIEEGGFKLPAGIGDADGAEGTRIEEGGFPLPVDLGGSQSSAAAKDSGFRLEIPLFRKTYDLPEGDSVVGRSGQADIRINMPDVSSQHAVISIVNGKVTVKDNGSSNKTYVAGGEIGGEPVEVAPDTDLKFGSVPAKLVRG